MSLGVYKPGQGYWTRVCTAAGLAVLALSGALWLWSQIGAVQVRKTAWVMDVAVVSGAPAPGQHVVLSSDQDGRTRIGEGVVASVAPAGRSVSVTINQLAIHAGADAQSTRRVEAADASGGSQAFAGSVGKNKQGIAAFNLLYVQSGVVLSLVLVATLLVYWLTATRPSSNEFLIAVDAEMRKVNWSTRREVMGSTWVVIVICGTITAVLFTVDFGFSAFFRWTGVLGA